MCRALVIVVVATAARRDTLADAAHLSLRARLQRFYLVHNPENAADDKLDAIIKALNVTVPAAKGK